MEIKQRLDILENIKNIPTTMPGIDLLSMSMVAEYFGVKQASVSAWCKRHENRLNELGSRKLSSDDFKQAGYKVEISRVAATCEYGDCKINMNIYRPSLFINRESMCEIAEGLHNSDIAARYRAALAMNENESGGQPVDIDPCVNTVESSNVENFAADEQNVDLIGIDLDVQNAVPDVAATNIVPFTNATFGELRTLTIDGEPWFVAADVCRALEIASSGNAIARLDDDEKGIRSMDTLGGYQNMIIINEPGLYSLVLGSRKPEAKEFKRWITHDVIPALRKTGTYSVPSGREMTDLEKIAESMLLCQGIMEQRAQRILQLEHRNAELEYDKASLKQENAILAGEARKWDYRSLVNRLVRSYAWHSCGNRHSMAWDEFHKQLGYKHHINLRMRKATTATSNKVLIDRLTDAEWPLAAQVAAAMCRSVGIEVEKVVNEANAELLNVSGD